MTSIDMCAFDLETDGTDVEACNLLTACVAQIIDGVPSVASWMACPSPDFVMPDEAGAVNGLTTERIRVEGRPIAEVVDEVTAALAEALSAGLPVVGHNLSFDFTVLDRNCRRHGVKPLTDRATAPVCIDTMVLDKHLKPFRRRVSKTQGPYQLKTTCQVWGRGWDDDAAHEAEYDALQAARVAWKMLRTSFAGVDLGELHDSQVEWAREQAASLSEWLVSQGLPPADGSWPMRAAP